MKNVIKSHLTTKTLVFTLALANSAAGVSQLDETHTSQLQEYIYLDSSFIFKTMESRYEDQMDVRIEEISERVNTALEREVSKKLDQ